MVREIASCYEVRVTPVPRPIRSLLLLGSLGLVLAIVLELTARSAWTGYLAAAAAAAALLGLHRLGRAGPDRSLGAASTLEGPRAPTS